MKEFWSYFFFDASVNIKFYWIIILVWLKTHLSNTGNLNFRGNRKKGEERNIKYRVQVQDLM